MTLGKHIEKLAKEGVSFKQIQDVVDAVKSHYDKDGVHLDVGGKCKANSDCDNGEICNTTTGNCVPDVG